MEKHIFSMRWALAPQAKPLLSLHPCASTPEPRTKPARRLISEIIHYSKNIENLYKLQSRVCSIFPPKKIILKLRRWSVPRINGAECPVTWWTPPPVPPRCFSYQPVSCPHHLSSGSGFVPSASDSTRRLTRVLHLTPKTAVPCPSPAR